MCCSPVGDGAYLTRTVIGAIIAEQGFASRARVTRLLLVPREKLAHPGDRFAEDFVVRQEHESEMIGRRPVEAAALDNENTFLAKQIQRESRVVLNVETLRVESGEEVESALRLHAGDPRNRGDSFVRDIALVAETAAGDHEVVDALVASERG